MNRLKGGSGDDRHHVGVSSRVVRVGGIRVGGTPRSGGRRVLSVEGLAVDPCGHAGDGES